MIVTTTAASAARIGCSRSYPSGHKAGIPGPPSAIARFRPGCVLSVPRALSVLHDPSRPPNFARLLTMFTFKLLFISAPAEPARERRISLPKRLMKKAPVTEAKAVRHNRCV
jgi:hypothetical protein